MIETDKNALYHNADGERIEFSNLLIYYVQTEKLFKGNNSMSTEEEENWDILTLFAVQCCKLNQVSGTNAVCIPHPHTLTTDERKSRHSMLTRISILE